MAAGQPRAHVRASAVAAALVVGMTAPGLGPLSMKFGSGGLRMSGINAPKPKSQAKRRKLRRGKR